MASSEHQLDDNSEAEASEEETPYNCRGLQHLFDVTELRDYHRRPEETEYQFLPKQSVSIGGQVHTLEVQTGVSRLTTGKKTTLILYSLL